MLAAFVVLGAMLAVLVRLALPPLWRRRRVRWLVKGLLALDVVMPAGWYVLKRLGQADLADSLVSLQLLLVFGQVAALGLAATLGLLRATGRWPGRGEDAAEVSSRRRFLLNSAAVALPAAAAAVGVGGLAESAGAARVRRRTVEIPGLPAALAGLRILHFSDVHLWNLVTLHDLGAALALAPRGEYDLVCVTGDLADDMSQLPRALELIADLDPPLGCFACLGNHEHARGLPEALSAYADSRVSLLRGSGTLLEFRGHPFILAGIDDMRVQPRVTQRDFYPDQLRRALGPTSVDAVSVVLSHRPSVLPHAAETGVDLVLAGHTHGGQMAVGERSILEMYGAAPWAWGVYRRRDTVMHVTCGLGQWFPFRLGCPPEMVLLELAPLRNGAPVP